MAFRGNDNAADGQSSSRFVRDLPSELPMDGSIQVAYLPDGKPIYVYYDYDANVYRNYQTDEPITIEGLSDEMGAPFHFFADDSTEQVESNAASDSRMTEMPVSDNETHAVEEHMPQQRPVGNEVTKGSIQSISNVASRFTSGVRDIIECVLNGESSTGKILEREQALFSIHDFKEKMFADYSLLVETTHEKRRVLSADTNEAIASVRQIINSIAEENKQYRNGIKENSRIVSEKQFIIYNELSANFQNSQQVQVNSSSSDYEVMKRSYVECWNLRKKIVENLRIMYDFEVVVCRLQYLFSLFNAVSTRILDTLAVTAKNIDSWILDFVSAWNDERTMDRHVNASANVKNFRENSRIFLNDVDGILVGIDKRNLLDRLTIENEKRKIPVELAPIRENLPTVQIDPANFLVRDKRSRVANQYPPARQNVRPNHLVNNADFVSLAPSSTVRINDGTRFIKPRP